jgi:hypothetical protein
VVPPEEQSHESTTPYPASRQGCHCGSTVYLIAHAPEQASRRELLSSTSYWVETSRWIETRCQRMRSGSAGVMAESSHVVVVVVIQPEGGDEPW